MFGESGRGNCAKIASLVKIRKVCAAKSRGVGESSVFIISMQGGMNLSKTIMWQILPRRVPLVVRAIF